MALKKAKVVKDRGLGEEGGGGMYDGGERFIGFFLQLPLANFRGL